MIVKSSIIDIVNIFFKHTQDKCQYLWNNSYFLKNLDKLIYISILSVFISSTFCSSDYIGYASLITLFLTVIKIMVKKQEKIDINLPEAFLLIYFLIIIISLFGSSLFHLSIKGFLKTFTYLGFYFSTVMYYKNNLTKIQDTIFIIAICVASQGIIGIFQNFSQVAEISTWQDISNINPEDVMTRVYGSIQPYNPNLLGGYLVAGLPCLYGTFFIKAFSKSFKLAFTFLLLAVLTTFTLVLSGCRGAYIGLFFIILSMFSFLAKHIFNSNKKYIKNLFITVSGILISVVFCIIMLISSIRTRILSIFAMREDSSTSFRFNVYQSAFQMLKDNWILGIGIGNQNFREIYGLYMKTGFDALSAYCVYLEIAVESGFFALIAFLGFVITLIFKTYKYIIKCNNSQTSIILITAITSVIAVLIHGIFDTIFFRPQVQFIFWVMVSFISSLLNPKNCNCS